MATIDWTEEQVQTVRAILVTDWALLTQGDLSIILLALQTHDEPASVIVLSGTAHAKFWQHMVTLEWADEVELGFDMGNMVAPVQRFQPNEFGRTTLPAFIEHYDLMRIGKNAQSYARANGLTAYYNERKRFEINTPEGNIFWLLFKAHPFIVGGIFLLTLFGIWERFHG